MCADSRLTLTVTFDVPFWVGVFERVEGDRLTAARVVFGAEPKDYEVYAAVLKEMYRLKYSPPVAAELRDEARLNPKRVQREIRRQMEAPGISTKSQLALQAQREANKLEKRASRRERREEEAARDFALRRQKKKEKHRGH